jgi:hypothetical protein
MDAESSYHHEILFRSYIMICQPNFKSCLLVFTVTCATTMQATAQDGCCFEPTYRLQCETVMQPQTVQKYRISYETEYVPEEVTSYRPVLKTRTEERTYKVAKPIVETSYREERYTVWKPVVETSYRDETVTQTRYVTETAEREEQYTTYRPVVETSYREEQYAVQRPVLETQYQTQQYAVQRPVVETQMQTQQVTSMRPVTTMQTQTVDQGGYVAQQVVQPGHTSYSLNYARGTCNTPGGLFWTPQTTPATVQTQYSYRPNLVTQQVARTSFVPQVQQVQVPVQVQRMQTEIVSQRVPIQVQRMQTEMVTQRVPVQTTRMVASTQVRKVPYVVQRPVTETLTRKIPVQQQRWVSEERVRKVPVQTTRTIYETRKEPVQVQYYEQQMIKRTVMKPVTRQKCVPYTETVMVPKQVVQRVPLSYHDPFSPAIVSGYSSFSAPTTSSTFMKPAASTDSLGDSILESDSAGDAEAEDAPRTRLQKVEMSEPESAANVGSEATVADTEQEQESSGEEELLPPAQSSEKTDDVDSDSTKATEAGWRIRWNPLSAHEV